LTSPGKIPGANVAGSTPGRLDATLSGFVESIKRHRDFRDAVTYHRYVPPHPATHGPSLRFHPELTAAMKALGPARLFTHQVEAIEHLRKGAHVAVSTPTASGKSLIYNLAVMERALEDPEARFLYVFPLKALERDQLKTLNRWLDRLGGTGLTAEIYDGDTTPYRRKKIRERIPRILFTNPDMLHRGILGYHQNWEKLLGNLAFVVLDEVHTYRGIFGSHLNQVIRRLKRVCESYGANPRFILLSGTIENPKSFSESLIGDEVAVVDSAGAPRSGQHFLFVNPEASANFSAVRLFAHCIRRGLRTIAFTQSRKVTELIHLWTAQLTPEFRKKISSYRAGFMPRERRDIERRLACGDLLGVVSTSALEMGIDIGYLDVCLLVGYPGTIINTWQRGGRVGRAGRDSLVILIGKPDALDQYFMKHPESLFERSFEAAVLDPHNSYVVEAHLPCAAAEIPLTLGDGKYWGERLPERLERLESAGLLSRSADGEPTWFATRRRPHLGVNIRSAGDSYTIFDRAGGQAIGTIDGIRAFKECHPGAVYLHRAEQYLVDRLVLEKKDVIAHRTHLKYFTRSLSEKETEILQVHRSRPKGQFLVREGKLKVTETINGFEKRALPGQELMGTYPLELPPQTFETIGMWVEIEPELKRYVEARGLHFMGGIHAVEHAVIGLFPLFALCDRNDIGGISYTHHPELQKSAVFIYDGHPGGVGLAQRGFDVIEDLLQKTLDVVSGCECEEGCPSCIHSPKCGSGNKPLDKAAAVLVLKGLLGHIPFSEFSDSTDAEEPPLDVSGPDAVEAAPAGRRIIYFDLETQKTAKEVGGWKNAHLMRISVAVLYDSLEGRFLVFEEEEINGLVARLHEADLVVGFNIKGFDYKVLGAYTDKDLYSLPTFDVLEDVHRRLGFRLALDHLATETLNHGKSADGLQAVEWFRQGDMENLIAYCRQDVAVLRDLFEYGREKGLLIYREKQANRRVRLRVDWDLEELIKEGRRA